MKLPTQYKRAQARLGRVLESLDCLEESMQNEMYGLTPDCLFALDDAVQRVRRKAVALADLYRQHVIGFHLQQKAGADQKAVIERSPDWKCEAMNVPAQFALRQQWKVRVRSEAKVVEKLLHWAGGDPQAVFHSGETGALRANPWRTSLIEEACGRTYLVREPDGEPKVIAVSQFMAERKERE